MVKTTFEIRDEVYRKLVEASLKKYGNTRSLSKMANEVIEEHLKEPTTSGKVSKNASKELQERGDIVERTFGSWKIKETGSEYVRKLRRGWEKRARRLGI